QAKEGSIWIKASTKGVAKPTEKHLKEVKRIFRYLRGTVNTGLWYTKDSGFELTGFSDADYAGFLWMQTQLTDYGIIFKKIPIYYDSKSAIAISCNPVQHSRTKHIIIRYHFIKEHVEKGTIELYFVKTDYQLADIFTKALPVDRFNYLVRRLGMRSLSPQELERLAKSQIRRRRYNIIPAESKFKTPSSIIKDKYMMKAQLPSASRREDKPEVTLPPRKRLDIALGPRYEVGESSSAAAARPAGGFRADYGFVATVDREIMRDPKRKVGYRITDSWDEIVETLQGAPVSTDTELDGYVREFETRVRQDMDEMYTRLDDEQIERQLLAGQLNMLFRDRCAHAYTRQLIEAEARMSREALGRATDASNLVHGEVISLRTTVLGQISEIRELQVADHRR
nr:retrovirus-related Pol polyprotein from transposon TNT 1-94 [Tanacetum cinerariifolium]